MLVQGGYRGGMGEREVERGWRGAWEDKGGYQAGSAVVADDPVERLLGTCSDRQTTFSLLSPLGWSGWFIHRLWQFLGDRPRRC